MQIGAIEAFLRGTCTHAATDLFYLGHAAVVELINQEFFEATRAGGKNVHEVLSLKRLEYDEKGDDSEHEYRDFIEPAVPDMAVGVLTRGKLAVEPAAVKVISQ